MADKIRYSTAGAGQIVREELERAKQLIINHIRANGQNASGRTIASLHVEQKADGGVLWGRKPFGTLETGRRAGKVPYGFASIIRQWMADKGLHGTPMPYLTANKPHKYTPQERGDMSMAYAIARSIARRGTLLHRQGGRDDVYSNVIPTTLKKIADRFGALIDTQFKTIQLN